MHLAPPSSYHLPSFILTSLPHSLSLSRPPPSFPHSLPPSLFISLPPSLPPSLFPSLPPSLSPSLLPPLSLSLSLSVQRLSLQAREEAATNTITKQLLSIMRRKQTNLAFSADVGSSTALLKVCINIHLHSMLVMLYRNSHLWLSHLIELLQSNTVLAKPNLFTKHIEACQRHFCSSFTNAAHYAVLVSALMAHDHNEYHRVTVSCHYCPLGGGASGASYMPAQDPCRHSS